MSEKQEVTPMEAVGPPTPSSTSSENASTVSNAASVQFSSTATKLMEPTRPSSLPKPSGLKPPSKIGRLCSNTSPKPAVPISPRADGSSSESVRKLSDELSRKHLSDLVEVEEDEVTSSQPDRPRSHRKSSTGSTYSGMSMDTLWEKHPRRLSEAGLRRSSDHSVVLTEDTDSFIIGERVWVGGTKPGQIAYIGETQFAPGDWAGIVLDEPIGKNDGSVAGVRYFQCGERRGVFSRLTRLTRAPLPHALPHAPHDASPSSDAGSVFERPPSSAGGGRQRRALSPNGSVRSAFSTKMNASVSTSCAGEVRVGERVIVSSSRGSRAGTLRYVGEARFAPGAWAGVELDDPLGKNDGSVDGHRYFECAPRFGLFAPLSKVSRSPSTRRPGACAVHSNGRATPLALRRSNSRESLASLSTSVASSRPGARLGAQRAGGPRASSTPVSAKNALQELLREKQHHLERLMRERELERAEVAKVSMQADRAESALAQLKKEAAQANNDNEKLKLQLDKLNKLLEDEKQKVEDLMFRNEEENINKEDYNKYKELMEKEKITLEQRIRELEAEAALQTARADTAAATLLALEDQRSAETATIVEQHKEELTAAHTLSSELQKLLDEAYALLKEKENEKDSLGKSMSEELTRVKVESEKSLNEAKTKMAIAQTEFETQISVMTAKLQLAESKLEAEKQNLERLNKENCQTVLDLNTKLTQLQAAVDDKTHELNRIMSVNKEHEVNLNKEITKLKMELSSKVLDLEEIQEIKKKQEVTCKNLQEEITNVKKEYSNKVNEYEIILNEVNQLNEKNKTEIIELQQNLSSKIKEYEKLLAESSTSNISSEKLINEYKSQIHERDKEIIKLKDEFEQVTANFNIKHSKIAEEHRKEIDERNTKIDQLTKEIETHKLVLDQTKIEFNTLNSQFTSNVDELKTLKEENESLKKTVIELSQCNNELKAKISSMELEIGELKRQYNSISEKCIELEKAKEKIETEYMNLTGQTTDSNDQFNKLAQHLKETETELQQLKDKYRESANNHGRMEQELKQKLFKIQEDFTEERGRLVRSLDENIEKAKLAESKSKDFEVQTTELSNRLMEMEINNDRLLDENTILKNEIEGLKIKEQELSCEFDSIRKKLEVDIDRYKDEVSLLKAEGVSSEVKLMEKVDQLTEAQNYLNNKLEEARKHEDALQKVVDDMTSQLNNQKAHYEREIAQVLSQISAITAESDKYKTEDSQLRVSLQEKENIIKELTLKLEMLEVDFKSNLEIVEEKDRQIIQIHEELNKTTENKLNLEEQMNTIVSEATTMKQKYDNLIANSSAEEAVLKEQLTQLESLKKDISVLNQDKTMLQTKCQEITVEIDQLKTEHADTVTQLQENVNLNNELRKSLEDKDNLLRSHNNKNESDSNKLTHLQEEIVRLGNEISNKSKIIVEKETELTNLNNALQLKTDETQRSIAQLQNENLELSTRYKKEMESMNNKLKTLTNQLAEQEIMLEEFQHAKEKLTDLQTLLIKSDSDIKQLNNINDAQKLNYEDLNKQLQSQYDQYKKESKQIKHDLQIRVEEYQKELSTSKEQIKNEIEKQNQLQQRLSDAEKTILELTNKLELVTIQQTSNVVKDEKLEKLAVELQETRQSSAEALTKNEAIVNNLKSDIESKLLDLKRKDDLITTLQEEIKNLCAKLEITSRQKLLLEKEMAAKSKETRDNNDNQPLNIGQGDNAPQNRLQEEKEMMDGQVNFLNSVIVDMQRKNEQLMARVQALEGATIPNEPPLFNGRKVRAVAPRLFCDICDVFDAHDTDECPRQAAAARAAGLLRHMRSIRTCNGEL